MRLRVPLVLVIGWMLLAMGSPSASRASDAPADDQSGWISLFDGKTLAGWHKNAQPVGHGTGGVWAVEEGAIVGSQDPPGSGNGGILLTDKTFGDFELSLDMKPDFGIDTGVFLRCTPQGNCFQMMVDYRDNGNVGHIFGEGSGGFRNLPFTIHGVRDNGGNLVSLKTAPYETFEKTDYTITADEWLKVWKVGQWNNARVRVVGNPATITTWINGVKVCEFHGDTFAGRDYDKAAVAKLLGPSGHIALQVHGGSDLWPVGAKCRWKNIRLRPLSP